MRKSALFITCLLLSCCLGCSNLGFLQYTNTTQTVLTKKNYHVYMSNVRGESSGFYLFGIVPIVSPSFSEAMANLHQGIKMEGKAMALANVAEDQSSLYLFLFSLPKLTITADVVDFQE